MDSVKGGGGSDGLRAGAILDMYKLVYEDEDSNMEEEKVVEAPVTSLHMNPTVHGHDTGETSMSVASDMQPSAPTTSAPFDNIRPSPSDPMFISAGLQADNILIDIVRVMKRHMEINEIDEIVSGFQSMKKLIQTRIYFRPGQPYVRGTIAQLLTPNYAVSRIAGVYGTHPGVKGTFTAGAVSSMLTTGVSASSGAGSGAGAGVGIGTGDPTDPDEIIMRNQLFVKKLQYIKTMAMDHIKAWVYQTLPSYLFVKYVAGALHDNHVEGYITFDVSRIIYIYWLNINDPVFTATKLDVSTLDDIKYRITSAEQVQEFIDNDDHNGSGADRIDSYIELDLTTPHITCNDIFSPSLLQTKEMAWTILSVRLRDMYKKNPGMKGFSTYRAYRQADGTPDFRLVLLPLPPGTQIHVMTEFAALIATLTSKNRMLSGARQISRFEMEQFDSDVNTALLTVMAKLALMGFSNR